MTAICPRFDSLGFDDPSRIRRLGIMGGTFDPVHIGPLACAEQVRETFGLDGVVFVPAGDPWMKSDKGVSDSRHRLEMVRLAVSDNPLFDVSTIEIDRPGKTYTVDTLRAMRAHYPDNVELYFITGADAVFRILEWRDSEQLGRLAHLVAVTRPGYKITDARRRYFRTHANILHLLQVDVTALVVSSTDLRQKVRDGRSIRYLTPQPVVEYVARNGLYL